MPFSPLPLVLASYRNKEVSIGPTLSTKWQALGGFPRFFHQCPLFQDPVQYHIALGCHVPLGSSNLSFLVYNISLFFMILMLLKITDQLFCRMSLNLSLIMTCFLIIRLGLEEDYYRSEVPFSSYHISRCM